MTAARYKGFLTAKGFSHRLALILLECAFKCWEVVVLLFLDMLVQVFHGPEGERLSGVGRS